MSFELLKKEIIDIGLCQGCGLCAGACKHIEMEALRPTLVDHCILERDGKECGMCYQKCPQVSQNKFEKKEPKGIYSLKSKDEEILKRATNGGFITTITKHLLDQKELSEMVLVQKKDDRPQAEIVSNPDEIIKKAGVVYGRSGVLEKLNKALGESFEPVGIVGVPCEIRGAAELEERMKRDILKIGLFCNASIRTEQTDRGLICSPCCNGCPAGVNAQGYISLIREGKYQDAVDLIREKNPLPSICGRICTHECEFECTLIGADHPVAIRELKKFVTEREMERDDTKKREISKIRKETSKKIAIIGSGPAGLTAAYYLAKLGYAPTIYERSDKVGGMLRFGVPQFRLPEYVLDYDIQMIKNAGIEIITNKAFGPDLTIQDLKNDGYKAIFIATGQYKPRTLRLEGENLPNVHVAINFLIDRKYRYWDNKEEFKGKSLGIIGGGPVAIDVAQTALRLGAEKIHLVDIATENDLENAIADIPENELKFMKYHYTTSTSKITEGANGNLILNCYKIKWGSPDETGRKPIISVEGSEFQIPVDTVVIAVGQAVDFSLIDIASENKLNKQKDRILVDEITFETNIPGVFAGGDIITNSKAVAIAAIAHGREAAISIDRYLKGEDIREGRYRQAKTFFSSPLKKPKDRSLKPETLESATESIKWSFDEIDAMFNEDMALREARRCLSCNHFCSHCQDFPAIYSDITAGEVGSKKGFTTVVAWTERGKEIVENAINKGLFEVGKIDKKQLQKAIDLKAERELLTFEKTTRNKILDFIIEQGPSSIDSISTQLNMEPNKVRYEILRLVQLNKLEMKAESNMVEPIFSILCE
ncbi:MAG: FAD-dependent oxidoreductase [Promethearchaeota archaeon]